MKISNEFKVGAFVIFAIAVGVYFWVNTQNINVKETYKLKTSFNFAGGIKPNSIVWLSGIEVGRVDKVKFNYDSGTKVDIELMVNKDARVRTDSIAYISTAGMIGDTFIGITPGSQSAEFLPDGGEIKSEDPIEMREFMKRAEAIAQKLDETLGDVKTLAANLNNAFTDNRPRIDNIVKNIEETAINFNSFSDDIRKNPWKLLMKGKEK